MFVFLKYLKTQKLKCLKFVLYHDNASSHTAGITQNYFREINIEVLLHPSYSPDIDPCDFWLFGKLKNTFLGPKLTIKEELYLNAFEFFDIFGAAIKCLHEVVQSNRAGHWTWRIIYYPLIKNNCIISLSIKLMLKVNECTNIME